MSLEMHGQSPTVCLGRKRSWERTPTDEVCRERGRECGVAGGPRQKAGSTQPVGACPEAWTCPVIAGSRDALCVLLREVIWDFRRSRFAGAARSGIRIPLGSCGNEEGGNGLICKRERGSRGSSCNAGTT